MRRQDLHLSLDEQALAGHLSGLLDAHGSKDSRGDITQHTTVLGEAPALGGVGHNEGNEVGGVRGLGGSLLVEHLLGVALKDH